MRLRARELKGTLEIQSGGTGATILLRVPLRRPALSRL